MLRLSSTCESRSRAFGSRPRLTGRFSPSVSSAAAVIALIGMGRATAADPVNGWRWVFRTMLLYDGILLLGFFFFYHPPPRTVTTGSFWSKVKTLDWIGYFLLIAGLVPLLMGFAWSSDSTIGWHDPHSYVPVAIGFVGLIACLLYGKSLLSFLGSCVALTSLRVHRMEGNDPRFPRPPPLPERPQLPAVDVPHRRRGLAFLPRQQHLRM